MRFYHFGLQLLLSGIALIPGCPVLYAQQCPANIDFETGTFNGWTCYTGSSGTINNINIISLSLPGGPVPGRHTMYSSNPGDGLDEYGGFPKNFRILTTKNFNNQGWKLKLQMLRITRSYIVLLLLLFHMVRSCPVFLYHPIRPGIPLYGAKIGRRSLSTWMEMQESGSGFFLKQQIALSEDISAMPILMSTLNVPVSSWVMLIVPMILL